MTGNRPTSIVGGIGYPDTVMGKPINQWYVVVWTTASGRRHYVRTPPLWVGCPLTPRLLARFRAEVETSMARNPPI